MSDEKTESLVYGNLLGRVLASVSIARPEDEICFTFADGEIYDMFHEEECCEEVRIDDVTGDLSDLVGTPLLGASERSSQTEDSKEEGHATWTFYRFSTIKGTVVIRWRGTSNGCYSESVSFEPRARG